MNQKPDFGALLLEWLPAVWRERDNPQLDEHGHVVRKGDLALLLEAYGELLDAFHGTLEQRLYDSFPDDDADGNRCQPWLLPYFARLLDVRMVSPDKDGRRTELRDAVAWRQRKGTRVAIEAIAEAVGRFEVETQEGWKRVAITPRVDRPLLPESAYGEAEIPIDTVASARARHPALPATTLDLRHCSRAVLCDTGNPAMHYTSFPIQTVAPVQWDQIDWGTLPIPAGFQESRRSGGTSPVMHWSDVLNLGTFDGEFLSIRTTETIWKGQTVPHITYTGLGDKLVQLRGNVAFSQTAVYQFENLWALNEVQIDDAAVEMQDCAFNRLNIGTTGGAPQLIASRCVFQKIEAPNCSVRLKDVTVLHALSVKDLDKENWRYRPNLRLPWRQVNRHGLPCAPDSFQDVSARTVDLRMSESRQGLYHPRRVLLYVRPPEGHCSEQAPSVNWSTVPDQDEFDSPFLSIRTTESEISLNGEPLPLISYAGLGEVPVKMRGTARLEKKAVYAFHNLWLDNRVEVTQGIVRLENCAARHLKVFTAADDTPAIDAKACLFKRLEATLGLVRLEYVTALETLLAERLEASDSILMPRLLKDTVDNDAPAKGCIRYSRLFHIPLPADANDPDLINDLIWIAQGKRSALRCYDKTCTTGIPLFWNQQFGQPGCGVLHPDAKAIFRFGAEDGGEMGAYHELRYSLRQRAVLDKLSEFLPLGMEAVLVFDTSLACAPPKPVTH